MLQQAIFVPPGYTSLLYAHDHEDNSCPYNTALFKVSVFCMLLLLGSHRHMLAPLTCCPFVNRQHMFPVKFSNAMQQQCTCRWGLSSFLLLSVLHSNCIQTCTCALRDVCLRQAWVKPDLLSRHQGLSSKLSMYHLDLKNNVYILKVASFLKSFSCNHR